MTRLVVILALTAIASIISAPPAAHAQAKAAAREAHCAKKPNASEREICLDKDLTRRDQTLNEVYTDLNANMRRSDFKNLRTEQRKWLRARNRCGSNRRCLVTKYENRVAELEQMLENIQNPGKSHVEIGCDGPGQVYQNGECLNTSTNHDSDMIWHTTNYNDATNKGRYTALLRFGVPETDNVIFEAICTAGSGGDFATTVIGYNTGKLREGTHVALKLSVEEHRQSLDGEVYGASVEEGVSGILFRPGYDDPIWEALAHGSALTYAIKGRNSASLSLRNSGEAVTKFINTCQAMTVADRGKPGEPVLSAKNRTCNKFGSIKSKNSKTPVTVTFKNKTDSHRAVMWINFDGTPVEYAALNAGQSYTVKTYLTHPWMFTDGPGNCIEMYMPKAGQSVFNITADSPFFGPEHD